MGIFDQQSRTIFLKLKNGEIMRLTINFLMKKARQKNNGEIPVYVRFTMNSKRVELSAGIYCHPEKWDEVGQQIRGRNESARILSNRLDKIQDEIQDHYNQLKSSGGEFNVTTIKNKLTLTRKNGKKSCTSTISMDLASFPVRKAGLKMLSLWCEQTKKHQKTSSCQKY